PPVHRAQAHGAGSDALSPTTYLRGGAPGPTTVMVPYATAALRDFGVTVTRKLPPADWMRAGPATTSTALAREKSTKMSPSGSVNTYGVSAGVVASVAGTPSVSALSAPSHTE